jgi:hypothetical protein
MGQATATRDHMVLEADEPEDFAPDGGIAGRHFAYRSGGWKLVFDNSRSPVGLYDLGPDRYETTNLITDPQQTERVATMKLALENALTSERTAPVLSAGPGSVRVPGVVGLTQAAASTAIADAGLVVGTVTEQSSATVPTGTVISQSPTAGTTVAVGSSVSIAVSTGSVAYVLSPLSIAFGDQALNLASNSQTITLSSIGDAALPITSIALSGTNPTQFTQINNCGSSVPAGGSCTINVTFKPTSTGSKNAMVTVTAGDGAGTKSVSVSGTGVRSIFSVSPTTLEFGTVARNTTSAAKTVEISNIGTVVLPIKSILIGGTNALRFTQTNNCPAMVPVGSTCTVSVVFKPTSTGSKSASLKVTPGGGASAKSVPLSGAGI